MIKYVRISPARYQGVRSRETGAGLRAMAWSVINWVLLACVLAVNVISVILPLNRTVGEVADSFHAPFEPAAYAFSIWGLIYLALIAFAVFQLLPSQWKNPRVRATDGLFAATCLANAGWLFAWHFGSYVLSLVAIVVLLFALSAIYLFQRNEECRKTTPKWTERLFVLAPFSLYLAWICVSAIANAAALLPWAGFKGMGVSAMGWAVVGAIAGLVFGGQSYFMAREPRSGVAEDSLPG